MWQTERRAGDNRRSPELRESYLLSDSPAQSTALLHQSEKQIDNIDYFFLITLEFLLNDWMLCTIDLVGCLLSINKHISPHFSLTKVEAV